jgi:hypothetical protein
MSLPHKAVQSLKTHLNDKSNYDTNLYGSTALLMFFDNHSLNRQMEINQRNTQSERTKKSR